MVVNCPQRHLDCGWADNEIGLDYGVEWGWIAGGKGKGMAIAGGVRCLVVTDNAEDGMDVDRPGD